jgi:hydrogenase maturation protein HypF
VSDAFKLAFRDIDERELQTVRAQVEKRINTPLASSMGRLFDAAAAILGVRCRASYEGQAAMELESLAGSIIAEPLPMEMKEIGELIELDPTPMLAALGEMRQGREHVGLLAARFHETIIHAASHVAVVTARRAGLKTIVLGGGSFQNVRLLTGIRGNLEQKGFSVLVPRQLGPNDGAVSYGQAAIAAWLLSREK